MNSHESQQKYFTLVGPQEQLSPQEEQQLASNIQNGINVEECVTKLFLSNLRIVSSMANDFSGHGVATIDLISEGNTGLLIAARKFKPGKNAKFITYATYWVRQKIQQALAKQGRNVRLPAYMVDRQLKLQRVESELRQKLNREPTDTELCSAMKISPKQLKSVRVATTSCVSLDDDNNQENKALIDCLASPYEDNDRSRQLEALGGLIERLEEKEKAVISARFGIEAKKQTLNQLRAQFGVSKERIRQIEARALHKLHQWITNENYNVEEAGNTPNTKESTCNNPQPKVY